MENRLHSHRDVGPRPGRPRPRLSPSRAAVLETLGHQPEPVTVAALVALTRRHENTLREHLAGLVRVGLVRRRRAQPVGRGRPSWLYERTDLEPSTAREYAGLAATLARTIAELSGDPALEATRAGEPWGRRLLRDRGAVPVPPEEARDRLVELMADLGFAPIVEPTDPSQVRLTRCPLLEAAFRHPDVVCSVHLGLARGALLEQHADPDGTRLTAFSEPGACRLVVPPVPSPSEPAAGAHGDDHPSLHRDAR